MAELHTEIRFKINACLPKCAQCINAFRLDDLRFTARQPGELESSMTAFLLREAITPFYLSVLLGKSNNAPAKRNAREEIEMLLTFPPLPRVQP